MTSRSVPSSVAAVLQELELEQPTVVTKAELSKIAARVGTELSPAIIAERLVRHGWLRSLRTRDAWEFAPGARAGRITSGDPFIEVRATLIRRPDFPIVVAYESAAWLHRLTMRSPAKHVIAIPSSESVPHALRGFRVTSMWGTLTPETVTGLAVWRIETLVTLIGARPLAFRDWPNIGEWIATAMGRLNPALLFEELEKRSRSVWMRTGYLVETGGADQLAEEIRNDAPAGSGPFYLGPRQAPGRYDKHWEVHDSLLHHRKLPARDPAPPHPRGLDKEDAPGRVDNGEEG